MEERGASSDIFAIPDFWKSSRWLDTAVAELQAEGMFSVDVNSTSIEEFQYILTSFA
jgi:hypothetical protein